MQKIHIMNGTTKSRIYKDIEILTSREKRTQNATNPTGCFAMKTPRSIIGRRSTETARESLGMPLKNRKGNLK